MRKTYTKVWQHERTYTQKKLSFHDGTPYNFIFPKILHQNTWLENIAHQGLALVLYSSLFGVTLCVARIQQPPTATAQEIVSGWAASAGSGSAQG